MSLNTLPRCRRSRVRGGTLLGLILGVIIGLAVALSVVIYVAKVPIPFVNNVPVHNGDQDAAEDQKNRDWNPNTPLQMHGPVTPTSGADSAAGMASGVVPGSSGAVQQPGALPPPVEVTPSAPSESGPSVGNLPMRQTPPQPRPAPPRQPVASNAANAQPSPSPSRGQPASSDDALGDFAAAHVRAADGVGGNPNTAATADPFTYFVQTGAFNTTQDADAERARLSLLGMEAAVSERDQAGRAIYRVRVGPFQNRAAADQIKDRLTNNGFETALVRVQR